MTAMTTTIYSTTGTAPLTFDRISPELIQITDEHGSTQLYHVADLEQVCKTESNQEH